MKNVVEQHNIKKLSYLSEPIWNRCPCIPPSPRHDLQEPYPLETMWRWAAAKVIPYPKRRDDASGSRQNKVKLLVPSGTSVYSRLGEISSPSQVYWLGMRSSYRNAELVNVKLMVNTPFFIRLRLDCSSQKDTGQGQLYLGYLAVDNLIHDCC